MASWLEKTEAVRLSWLEKAEAVRLCHEIVAVRLRHG